MRGPVDGDGQTRLGPPGRVARVRVNHAADALPRPIEDEVRRRVGRGPQLALHDLAREVDHHEIVGSEPLVLDAARLDGDDAALGVERGDVAERVDSQPALRDLLVRGPGPLLQLAIRRRHRATRPSFQATSFQRSSLRSARRSRSASSADHFEPGHPRRNLPIRSAVTAWQKAAWCAPPASIHAWQPRLKSGRGIQTARAVGSFGIGCSGFTTSSSATIIRIRPPMSTSVVFTAGPACASKTRRAGIGFAADVERVDLERRLAVRDGRTHLEHVRAEHPLLPFDQVVRVVLDERHAAGPPRRHHLAEADERGGLPVALGAEAVPVRHQPLAGQAGKLLHAVQVLERGGECTEPALLEERAHGELLTGRVAQASRACSPPLWSGAASVY